MTDPSLDPASESPLDQQRLIEAAPIPVLWLLGKTASGKSSIVRFLTGADEAEIGKGFSPQTRHSRMFEFPDASAPIIRFLDTRGLGEADYDPDADLTEFDDKAHLLIVTLRAMDQALEQLVQPLKRIRRANPHRPVLLVLTCLHDGYPGSQHADPDPFGNLSSLPESLPLGLRSSIDAQLKRFEGLFDKAVAIDLTSPNDGFDNPELGGQRLKETILEMLPAAYRQSLIQIDQLQKTIAQGHNDRVAPVILAHSSLAATAAAIPMPWADIPLVLGIQTRLAYRIAKLNNQSLDAQTIASVTSAMGGRIAARMVVRESLKVIPWLGSAVNAATTFAWTFAAGWAWNWYFMEVNKGHIPTTEELSQVYKEQLQRGENFWKATSVNNSD